MGSLREEEFDSFLKRRLASSNGILIHGADEAAVALLGRQVAKALGGEVQRVDIAAAKATPGIFMDDFLSLSLLGDRQVLLVDGADEYCLKFLEPAFAYEGGANFAIILAGSLGKSSKLRAAAEASAQFACLALYEEDEVRLAARLRKFLESHGLRWAAGGEEAFFAAVGVDRAMAMQEAEKLALYMLGKGEIAEADVQAVCGDLAEFGADQWIDAALSGDLEETDRIASQLGAEARSLLPLVQLHLNTLQNLRAEMDHGASAEGAIAASRPPVFFKRKPALLQQLRRLSMRDLLDIQETFSAAVFQSRKMADLSEALVSRAMLSIARASRARSH